MDGTQDLTPKALRPRERAYDQAGGLRVCRTRRAGVSLSVGRPHCRQDRRALNHCLLHRSILPCVSSDRLSVVLAAMAAVDRDASKTVIDRVCGAAIALLSLQGAGLSLIVDGELCGTAGVSDAGIRMVQELQLTLGEGPCVDAWTSGIPVLEPDLATSGAERWPTFSRAAVAAGVLSVFALPLHIGAIRIGVLVLYRGRPGTLNGEELADGIVLAEVATHVVLAVQAGASTDVLHQVLVQEPAHWAEVHQATGMVSAQLGVSLSDAFVRLRAYAFAGDHALREVAGDVVAHRLRLEPA